MAAGALTAIVTGIYGAIAWGMFTGSTDYVAHIGVAKGLYETGRPSVPHFLFHALTGALFRSQLTPSLISAGRLVLIVCYILTSLTLYLLLWTVFRNSTIGRPSILFVAGLATLLAQPITLAHGYALGFLWLEPYQIPTSMVLKPFALAGFIGTAWFLFRRCRADLRLVGVFAFVTIAGSLAKPSFIICLLPASVLLLWNRFVRQLPYSFGALLAGLFLPAAAVLGWQFYASFSGSATSGMYHDSVIWAPVKFMSFWSANLFPRFLLSLAYPLVVTGLYWKEARRDTMLQLAWLAFLFGSFYTYLLAEKANWSSGNFVWSGYIAAFILFVASTVFLLRRIDSATWRGWSKARVLLCAATLAVHAISGVRVDWIYLTHLGCTLNFQLAELVCRGQ